jgi:hypothetical protein
MPWTILVNRGDFELRATIFFTPLSWRLDREPQQAAEKRSENETENAV